MRALLVIALLFQTAYASEDRLNRRWCADNNGKPEVTLDDKSRVDCVVRWNDYIFTVEADWVHKAWSEGVGQSLLYAEKLDGYPVVLVLPTKRAPVGSPKYMKEMTRLRLTAGKYGIFIMCADRKGKAILCP